MPRPRPARTPALLLAAALVLLSAAGAPAELRWRKLPASPLSAFRHDDVFFLDARLGWVVNINGFIYKTTDGGASWTELLHQPTSVFRCVGFADESRGWVGNLSNEAGCFTGGADPALLYATTDGGVSWAPVTNIPEPRPKGLCSLWVVDEDVVFAAGRVCDTPRVIRTTDGGATWTTFDLGAHATRLIDCFFRDAQHGFVVGGRNDGNGVSQGIVLETTDGGASWRTVHQTDDPSSRWCWKITAPTASTMVVSVQINNQMSPYVLKTTDGGASWEPKPVPAGPYFEQGIGFATEDLGWIGGDAETWETTDGGDSWAVVGIGTPNTDDNVNRFRFLTPTLGYAVGRKVYKFSDDEVVAASVLAEAAEVPWLSPASPNPTRGATRLDYAAREAGRIRIAVYDILGSEVAVLVDRPHERGRYSVELPAGRLVAGVYLARMESPTRNECRKLVILE